MVVNIAFFNVVVVMLRESAVVKILDRRGRGDKEVRR